MQKNAKVAIAITTILFLTILPLTAASITLNYPRQLGYGNGTYVSLPAGTYNNISRIAGIWYVNGAQYPPLPTPTAPGGGQSGGNNPTSPTPTTNPNTTPNTQTPQPTSNPILPDIPKLIEDNPIIFYFVVGVVFLMLMAIVFSATRPKKHRGTRWKKY